MSKDELITELVEALREAIDELTTMCEEVDGEGYNNLAWNDLIALAEARP